MSRIGDGSDAFGMSPAEAKKMYKSQYKEAASKFEEALDADKDSTYMFQKYELQKNMDQFLQVLKDAANALKQDNLINQTEKIEQDLAKYKEEPTPASIFQLHQDLEKAKKI